MTFQPGSKFLVCGHKNGVYSRDDVVAMYLSLVTECNLRKEQEKRVSDDLSNLLKLSTRVTYCVTMRRRVGERAEMKTVVLKEYDIQGRTPVMFTSKIIIWDATRAKDLNRVFTTAYKNA